MPVSFDRINAREFRHRCFIFTQLKALAKSKAGSKISGLKKAVNGGFSRVVNPPAGDPAMLFVIAHRMDTTGDSRQVHYTTLFSLAAKFYIFKADPARDESFTIVMCAKLTMQHFAGLVAMFARDSAEQFGFQDARLKEVADENEAYQRSLDAAPISHVDFPSGGGQQMMPAISTSTQDYGSTPRGVGGQTGFVGGQTSFAQAIQQVPSNAEEIYIY